MAYKDREKYRERNRRQSATIKEKMASDPEYAAKMREKWKIRKQKLRDIRGEKINEYQRDFYRRNKERIRGQIYSGKDRRDPTRGLKQLIRDVRRGEKQAGELFSRLSRTIEQVGTLILRAGGDGVSGGGSDSSDG